MRRVCKINRRSPSTIGRQRRLRRPRPCRLRRRRQESPSLGSFPMTMILWARTRIPLPARRIHRFRARRRRHRPRLRRVPRSIRRIARCPRDLPRRPRPSSPIRPAFRSRDLAGRLWNRVPPNRPLAPVAGLSLRSIVIHLKRPIRLRSPAEIRVKKGRHRPFRLRGRRRSHLRSRARQCRRRLRHPRRHRQPPRPALRSPGAPRRWTLQPC